ncbi:MAG: hypothetical protein A2Z38_07955 [Planctomycetes bacterium RBG_19FT_COMBO_48_8]|nr:MAG: hypothetical protein A2Z38_07955 [Planctomycetes bacterium RBG_19FT_COMBO_48_8]
MNSGLTVAAWINRASTGTYDIIFGAGRNPVGTAAGDDNNGWKFGIDSGDVIKFTTLGILDYTSSVGVPVGEWSHIAATFNEAGTELQVYLNGTLVDTISGNGPANPATGLYAVGFGGTWALEFFDGMLDEVRVYNQVLTGPEIVKLAVRVKAWKPDPEDGTLYADTWVSLTWTPGGYAVSHDVYMGENFDDVNDGTGDTFRGNYPDTFYIAGFFGYAYPDGLVPGTTYYWRIDEVNDADTNSPWKGDVWSFTVPPRKAYNPVPNEGSKYLASGTTTLSWTAGLGAKLRYVYFGDDFDTVANATGGTQQVAANYTTGPLELGKTYYWRVDESDGIVIYTGDVWSFSTRPEIPITDPNLVGWWKLDEGMGNIVLDWSGHDNHGTLANGPIWMEGNDGGALQFDGLDDYVNLGTPAELYIPDNYTYTAWFRVGRDINGDSGPQYLLCIGSRSDLVFGVEDAVGVDGDLSLHYYDTAPGFHAVGVGKTVWSSGDWHMVAGTKDSATGHKIYLDGELKNSDTNTNNDNYATSRMISLGARAWTGHQYFNGTIDDVRIYNRTLAQDEIQKIMRGDLFVAWSPSPAKGSTPGVDEALPLTWSPGDSASQHDVYFGTDLDAVADADESDTTGIYRGRQSGTSFTPLEGIEWGGGPYYWRIDEYNTDGSISEGRIWRFTVADYILVDDFESYDAGDNQIWYAWHDGLGYGALGTANYFAGNGTGAAVGDETTFSYTEESIVNSGRQSMPVVYDNNKQGYSKYSEVELTLTAPRDWTKSGVTELSLWFRGYPGSVGSFVEGPVGTYTMTGSGTDIWDVSGIGTGYHDEFHFAYKTLTGAGSIVAKVNSVQNTNGWAKAGVMIRETLDADSAHAMVVVTPAQGVSFQRRNVTGDTSADDTTAGISAPYWVKIERDLSGNFTTYSSTNGSTWQMQGTPDNISMSSNVYIGLAVTSHNAALTCQAVFSNVTTTGSVGPQWAHQDIGIASNAAEPMYVAISNSAGTPAVVVNDDPAAATIDAWTEWIIPLQAFADQGIALTNVDRIAIGLGTRGNITIPGGSGKIYIDDIRLYRTREAAE